MLEKRVALSCRNVIGVEQQQPQPGGLFEPVVSALVITLGNHGPAAAGAVERISAHPAIRRGRLQDRWLPVSVETPDQRELLQLENWLLSLEGVESVAVVAINVDTEAEAAATAS